MSKKPIKSTPEETASNIKKATDTCAKVLAAIDSHVDQVVAQENVTDHEMRMVVHLSGLGNNVAKMGSEVRKMEAHEAKAELSDVAVLDFMRKKTPIQRAQWVKDIAALDRKGSVLG